MAKPIPQIPRRIRKRADTLPTVRQQLFDLLASAADGGDLAHLRATFAEIMAAAGLDPRPSVFDDLVIWGLEVVEGASAVQIGPRRMVARVRKASASMGEARTHLDAAGWRRLESLRGDLPGIRVERLVQWSVDQQTWTRFSPGQARVLGEVELAELRLLRARMDAEVLTREEMARIREQALAQVGSHPRYSYLRWATDEPDSEIYYVIILLAPDDDREWSVLPGPHLPPVISLAQLQELAAVSPDTLVVDIQGQTKRQVLAGFTAARATGNGARHSGQVTAAEAVAATAADDPGEGEYLLLRDLVREDMDWLWVGVERRRRLRGEPTARTPMTTASTSGGTLLTREDARKYVCDVLDRFGGRLTPAARTKVAKAVSAEYPQFAECPTCKRWWIHGCAHCRSPKRLARPCPSFSVTCPACYGRATVHPGPEAFGGNAWRIDDEIRWHRAAARRRLARRSAPPRG